MDEILVRFFLGVANLMVMYTWPTITVHEQAWLRAYCLFLTELKTTVAVLYILAIAFGLVKPRRPYNGEAASVFWGVASFIRFIEGNFYFVFILLVLLGENFVFDVSKTILLVVFVLDNVVFNWIYARPRTRQALRVPANPSEFQFYPKRVIATTCAYAELYGGRPRTSSAVCTICLVNYSPEDVVSVSRCSHMFHAACVLE